MCVSRFLLYVNVLVAVNNCTYTAQCAANERHDSVLIFVNNKYFMYIYICYKT